MSTEGHRSWPHCHCLFYRCMGHEQHLAFRCLMPSLLLLCGCPAERDPLHQGLIVERSKLQQRSYTLDLKARLGKTQVVTNTTPINQQVRSGILYRISSQVYNNSVAESSGHQRCHAHHLLRFASAGLQYLWTSGGTSSQGCDEGWS